MKKYFLLLFNFLKINMATLFKGVNYPGSKIQSFSKYTKLDFQKDACVTFKKNIQSDGFCRIICGSGAELSIGTHTYFNTGCVISSMKSITIGDNCLFGPNVSVFDNNHVFTAKNGVTFEHNCENVKIGNNCWIAANVVILKGTNIGNNCVIGAGCKVSGIIPDGTIVTCSTDNHFHKIEDR